MLFKSCRTIGICVISMALPTVCVAKSAVDARLERLETMVSNQLSVDLLNQVDALQQEVQELRGVIEEQQNSLQQLADRQEKLFANLDSRISPAAAKLPTSDELTVSENTTIETTDSNISNLNINNNNQNNNIENESELFPTTEQTQNT